MLLLPDHARACCLASTQTRTSTVCFSGCLGYITAPDNSVTPPPPLLFRQASILDQEQYLYNMLMGKADEAITNGHVHIAKMAAQAACKANPRSQDAWNLMAEVEQVEKKEHPTPPPDPTHASGCLRPTVPAHRTAVHRTIEYHASTVARRWTPLCRFC